MRICRTCGQKRDESEFFRVIKSPNGFETKLPTGECVRCISDAAKKHFARKKRRLV